MHYIYLAYLPIAQANLPAVFMVAQGIRLQLKINCAFSAISIQIEIYIKYTYIYSVYFLPLYTYLTDSHLYSPLPPSAPAPAVPQSVYAFLRAAVDCVDIVALFMPQRGKALQNAAVSRRGEGGAGGEGGGQRRVGQGRVGASCNRVAAFAPDAARSAII